MNAWHTSAKQATTNLTGNTVRANVKPFTHWVIYKGYTVRFTTRTEQEVADILTTPAGQLPFVYRPATMTIHLPKHVVTINEHGWELKQETL